VVKIAPSILSANFASLSEDIKKVERAGVEYLHIDVMDGHFVPNITIGPLVVAAIRPQTELFFDIHLMIENPDLYVKEFCMAGAGLITVHVEACRHLHRTVMFIKEQGIKVGVALNPATPLVMVEEVLPLIDMVLLMTVNPGFAGQAFIPDVLPKIAALKEMLIKRRLEVDIQVDGGINRNTVGSVVRAGANVLVAGSAVFGSGDVARAVDEIRRAAEI